MTQQEAEELVNDLTFRLDQANYTFRANGTFTVIENGNQSQGLYRVYQAANGKCYLNTVPQIFQNDLVISIKLTDEVQGGSINIT